MKKICALFLGISLSVSAHAAIDPFEGVEMGTLELEGKTYEFPIVPEAGKGMAVSKNDLYYLKKALQGDKDAREIVMGGASEKWLYIGRESPRWILMKNDGSVEVVTP